MSSGVGISPECVEAFEKLKASEHQYIIYKLDHSYKEIIVDKASENKEWQEFTADLPEDEPRFAVYNFEYSTADDERRTNIVFVSWSPDSARVRAKMVYASSIDVLKGELVGVGIEVKATKDYEIDYNVVLNDVRQCS